jgi:hypothetical protein
MGKEGVSRKGAAVLLEFQKSLTVGGPKCELCFSVDFNRENDSQKNLESSESIHSFQNSKQQ